MCACSDARGSSSNRGVLPGAETTWERVLLAISDITARKKAEAYLSYLGTHDVLTALKNRTHYNDACHRLEREARYPISVVVIDLNGLKRANDTGGHEAGDALIRRRAAAPRGTRDAASTSGSAECGPRTGA